jgi:hypothetical protein
VCLFREEHMHSYRAGSVQCTVGFHSPDGSATPLPCSQAQGRAIATRAPRGAGRGALFFSMILSTRYRLDPNPTAAPWACLVPQTMVHRHTPSALALRAVSVRRVQRTHSGDRLQLELRRVFVDHHEALLCEHRAIEET